MTTEQHKILYNLGMNLSCDNKMGWHLCPNKRNYDYFAYWVDVSGKDGVRFGRVIKKKKIQIKRQTGVEEIKLNEPGPICKTFTKRKCVEMVLPQPCNEEQCICLNELADVLQECIRKVAIEKTLVLKENEDNMWHMPMIDFSDIFDEQALLTHFKSLIQCFLEEIVLGNKGTDVIDRMTDLLQNWEQVYDERKTVLAQIDTYISTIIKGIEKTNKSLCARRYTKGQINKDLNIKRNVDNCLSFLLTTDFNREYFQECATILAAFLRAYAKDDAEKLLLHLQKYVNQNIQINKIKRLKKINLHAPESKKANAKLIQDYLRDDMKSGNLLEFSA